MHLCNVPYHLPLVLCERAFWESYCRLQVVCWDFTGMANSFLFLMFLYGWLDLSEIIWCHVAYLHVCFLLFLFYFIPWCNFLVLVDNGFYFTHFYKPHLRWCRGKWSCAGAYLLGVSSVLFWRETDKLWVMRTLSVEKPKRSALLSLVALCPWSGIGWSMPCPFSFFAVIIRQRDPRNVCNAWKIHPFFSGDIIDVLLWALQQNASECDGSIYEIMFYSFVFYAMLMDNDLGWLLYPGSRPVRGQFGASCLWRLEL